MDLLTWPFRSFVAFGERIRNERPERWSSSRTSRVESSAVDKFNGVSLYSWLPGLEYSKISDQIYNRTARGLSRRFSHKDLLKFHYDTVMSYRSTMGRLLSICKNTKKVIMQRSINPIIFPFLPCYLGKSQMALKLNIFMSNTKL